MLRLRNTTVQAIKECCAVNDTNAVLEICTGTCEEQGGTGQSKSREQGGRWSSTGVIRAGRFYYHGQKFRVKQTSR